MSEDTTGVGISISGLLPSIDRLTITRGQDSLRVLVMVSGNSYTASIPNLQLNDIILGRVVAKLLGCHESMEA